MFLKYLDMQMSEENRRLIIFSRLFAQTTYVKRANALRVGICTVHHQRDINTEQEAWAWNTWLAAPVSACALKPLTAVL